MVMCAVSCEKDGVKNSVETNDDWKESWTDDSPIIQFKDPKFLNALLNIDSSIPIDRNADGQISEKEAAVTTEITYGLNNAGIRDMSEIKYFTALTSLVCSDNQLTSLDVSNNTALTMLSCENNQLTTLDVSKNVALTDLRCGSNQLKSLDVSMRTELEWLICDNNQLTSLDVSNNTALMFLYCSDNQLTTLDVSNNTALMDLYCYSNDITSLDVSTCHDLSALVLVDHYQIGKIDYDTKLPLESLKIYRYHLLSKTEIDTIEEVYGDIIEYVE